VPTLLPTVTPGAIGMQQQGFCSSQGMDQTLTVPTLQRALTRYPAPDIHERLIRTIKEEKVDLSDYIKVPNLRGSVHSDRPDLIVGRFCVGWDAETLGF
jgi:hypothetical protein